MLISKTLLSINNYIRRHLHALFKPEVIGDWSFDNQFPRRNDYLACFHFLHNLYSSGKDNNWFFKIKASLRVT